MAQLRTTSHLIFLAVLGVLIFILGICHKTGVIDVNKINEGTSTVKRKTSPAQLALAKPKVDPFKTMDPKYKQILDSRGAPNKTFCDQNSHHADCCTKDHCALVQQSTLFSECCQNIVPQKPPGGVRRAPPKQRPISTPTLFPLLVTATPRSGTVFVQRLLKKLGVGVSDDFSIPHNDGMVSWMHVVHDPSYFGPVNSLSGSKFRTMWHQVRDPLKSLTSMAFTEPLREDKTPSQKMSGQYMNFLKRHLKMTKKQTILAQMRQQQQATMKLSVKDSEEKNDKNDKNNAGLTEQFLIYRGMEFYIQWHRFILDLKIPRFHLEDIVERKNMVLLDSIFCSIGRAPPNHQTAVKLIEAGRRRRRQLQRQLQIQAAGAGKNKKTTAYNKPKTTTNKNHNNNPNKKKPIPRRPSSRIPSLEEDWYPPPISRAGANNNLNRNITRPWELGPRKFIGQQGANPKRIANQPQGNKNSRKHRPTLEWHELCEVSVQLTRVFLEVSHELGYYKKKKEVC